jgi:hypothetical protein
MKEKVPSFMGNRAYQICFGESGNAPLQGEGEAVANMLSKMTGSTRLGSRIAEVRNGSSLFTGDAGQGESNIRRWIIDGRRS